MRGDRKKLAEKQMGNREDESASEGRVIDVRNFKSKHIPQLMWRECIKKILEVDPLTWPKCTGEMKIVSFIYKRTVIKKILIHLNV